MKRIPVTILTGFLGAGKTTLLNQIIADHEGMQLVVIENEFGQIGVDNALVVALDAKVFELSNGCICCNLNEDLLAVLSQLIQSNETIDHLIIETTGMADPGPVAMNFIADEHIQQYFNLNAIITLVDTQFVEQQLESQEEAVKQIALADLILMNKVDKVEPYQLDVLGNIVAKINDQAQVIPTTFGKVTGLDLLLLNAFDKEVVLNSALVKLAQNKSTGQYTFAKPLVDQPSFLRTIHKHQTVHSHSFKFSAPIDFLKFEMWVNMMLNINPDSIYRMKGILNIDDFDQKIIFQSVYNQHVSTSGGHWKPNETRESVLVIIGKNLNREMLQNGLEQIMVTAL